MTVTTPTGTTYKLNLSWTANTEPDLNHYNIYRSTTNGFTVNTATDTPIATPTTNSYSNTGLSPSTTYYYVVAAVNNSNIIGPVSSQASGTTVADTTIPLIKITSPANNATLPQGNILVQGTSSDDLGGSGVKTVAAKVDNGAYTTATPSAPGNWSTWSVTVTVSTTGTHTITARATDNSGNQNWSSITIRSSAGTGPAQVTGLSATAETSTQINLSWTANTDPVNHYNIYRSTTNGFTVNTATDTPIATPTANSYSNTGLSPSTTYYYVVAAVNNSNIIGPVSSQASAQTLAGTDTTIPLIAITSPAKNSSAPHGSILVQGTSSDSGSGVNIVGAKVDNGAYITATPSAPGNWSTWSVTVTVSTTGTHTITARATDNSANQNWSSITMTFT